jgi:hypothetical protein
MSAAKLLIHAVEAAGTVAVAALAIWGQGVRAAIAFRPKLKIERHDSLRGHPVPLSWAPDGIKTPAASFYYHLRVTNLRTWLPVRDCRVLLVGIDRRGPDGRFHSVEFPVPLQFIWAPEKAEEIYVRVTKRRVFDFGRIIKDRGFFEPRLMTYPISFNGHVRSGEAVRYHLEIDAATYVSTHAKIVEVAWDGHWDDAPEAMEKHLRITEI